MRISGRALLVLLVWMASLTGVFDGTPARAADPWARPDLPAATVENARWQSGVPLGGMGVGKVELYADGAFARATTNHNWDRDTGLLRDAFFAVAARGSGDWQGRLLRLFPEGEYDGVEKPHGTRFLGLFPRAWLSFQDDRFPLEVRLAAFSPLVAESADDSSLPVALFRVTLHNPSFSAASARLAFSWPNLVGFGGQRGISWNPVFGNQQQPSTTGTLEGLRFDSTQSRSGIERNVQGTHFIGVDSGAGERVWRVPTWQSGGSDVPWWSAFASGGEPSAPEPLPGLRRAGVVGLDLTVPPRADREVTFVLAWHMPEHVLQRRDVDGKGYGPTEDVGHWFANRFGSVEDVASYAFAQRDRLIAETAAWQQPVLDSNLPGWLAAFLLNASFPAVANTVLTRDGRFTSLESPVYMDGALGTMDQRMAGHGFYAGLYSQLDRRELDLFGAAQLPDGRIPHFLGNVHETIGSPDVSYGITDWPDLACSWIGQVVRAWRWTGDEDFARRQWPRVKAALAWLESADRDHDGIPEGGSTFDYEALPAGSFVYTATTYLGTLRLAADFADAMGDGARAKSLRDRFTKARDATIAQLWTGDGFRKWANGRTRERIDTRFAAALAGDWLARLGGSTPVFGAEIVDAAVRDSLFRHLKPFAPVPPMEVALDGTIAPTPTFLLQMLPYLGAEAIQAGYVRDGLEVFRRAYQVQWQKNGDPWSASLVYDAPVGNKGPLSSYLSAPGAWSALQALSGISLDRRRELLYVSPRWSDELPELHAPAFLPGAWLWIDSVPATRSLSVRVLRNPAGASPPTVRAVARDGGAAPIALAGPSTLTEGTTLVLDSYWDALTIGAGRNVDGAGPNPGGAPPADQDGDGVPDTSDNCPDAANGDQHDDDGDGVGDACDGGSDAAPDFDRDGTPNGRDNCPFLFNPFQTDADHDGQGDACDQSNDTDSDGDGVPDARDVCPSLADVDQLDSNSDGVGDACAPPPLNAGLGGGGCAVRTGADAAPTAVACAVLLSLAALRRLCLRRRAV